MQTSSRQVKNSGFYTRRKSAVADTEPKFALDSFLTHLLIEDKKNPCSSNKIKRSRDRKQMAVSLCGVLRRVDVYFSSLASPSAASQHLWLEALRMHLFSPPSLSTLCSLAWGTIIQHLWFHQSNSFFCPSLSRTLPLTFQSWGKHSSPAHRWPLVKTVCIGTCMTQASRMLLLCLVNFTSVANNRYQAHTTSQQVI